MSKYLEFVHIERKTKTHVWEVLSKEHGFGLGLIKYYPAWRQYAFFPYEGNVFNPTCMNDLIRFIEDEEGIRKSLIKKGQPNDDR